MEVCLELNTLSCQRKDHSGMPIIGFCIDKNCLDKNKFACSECFFDTHNKHEMLRIKDLNNIIQTKYKDYKNSLEEEKKLTDTYKSNEEEQKEKINKLKKDIIEKLENKVNDFVKELENKYNELTQNNARGFANLKEYENFFIGNAAPVLNPDLNKLAEICSNIYKESKGENNKNSYKRKETPKGDLEKHPIPIPIFNDSNKNLKNIFDLEKFTYEFNNYINQQLDTMTNYIKEKFLNIPGNFFNNADKFEWCDQTYSGYDFFYDLTNNKLKGTKVSSNGTMTILRAKEQLEENYLYKIKFKIGLKSGGDFDVGIGTDKVGESCWLRTKESLCISNIGIMNLDINYDNSIKLKDNDIIDLEINTEIGKKTFQGSINNKLVCVMDFDLKDVYIMAAMRNNNNFIEVLKYERSFL